MTATERKSDNKHPIAPLTGELWGIYYKNVQENAT